VIADFGSKKKQKMERSRKANIVDVTAIAAVEDVAEALRGSSAAASAAAAAAAAAAGGTGGGDADDDTEAAEGEAAPTTTSGKKVAASLAASRAATLPPWNVRATAPADIYPVEGWMPDAVVDAYDGPATAFVTKVQGGEVDVATAVDGFGRGGGEYVRNRLAYLGTRLADLAGSTDDGARKATRALKRKVRIVLYLKALFDLAAAPGDLRFKEIAIAGGKAEAAAAAAAAAADAATAAGVDAEAVAAVLGGDGEAAADAPPVPTRTAIPQLRFAPDAVVAHLLATFTVPTVDMKATAAAGSKVYKRTPQLVDKLRSYIAVATLTVDDFALDVAPVARALKLVPVKFAQLYREAGCTLTAVRSEAPGAGGAAAAAAAGAAAAAAGAEGGSSSAAGGAGSVASYVAKLTAPLVFPKLKIGRAR